MSSYSQPSFAAYGIPQSRNKSCEESNRFWSEYRSSAQNSYVTKGGIAPINSVYSAGGLLRDHQNSIRRTYGLGGHQNSVYRTYGSEGQAYDPGNSSDRLRWSGGLSSAAPPAILFTEEELERANTAALAKNSNLQALIQALRDLGTDDGDDEEGKEPYGFVSEDEADDDEATSEVERNTEGAETTIEKQDGGEKAVEEVIDEVKETDGVNDEEVGSEGWLLQLPEQYRERLRTVDQSFQAPSAEEMAKLDLNAQWTIWDDDDEDDIEACKDLFLRHQQSLKTSSSANSPTEELEALFESMKLVQQRAVVFLDLYHDYLMKAKNEPGRISRGAARCLNTVEEMESQLWRLGPRVLSLEMRDLLEELLAMDPYVMELQGYNVEELSACDEANDDEDVNEDEEDTASNSEDEPKQSEFLTNQDLRSSELEQMTEIEQLKSKDDSENHQEDQFVRSDSIIPDLKAPSSPLQPPSIHRHKCDVCGLKEKPHHWHCDRHEGGYDVCVGCYAAGHIRCPNSNHPSLAFITQCMHRT